MRLRLSQSQTAVLGLSTAYHVREWLRSRHSEHQRAQQERSRFYREAWEQAASDLGATLEHLEDDILEIRLSNRHTRVRQNTTPIDDPVTLMAAGNKPLVNRLLKQRGLPIPEYIVFSLSEVDRAAAFLKQSCGPCVVKPANSGGGLGVTANVTRTASLVRAAALAGVYSKTLMIEKQVEGDLYRLLYLDGELLDAIVRRPPTVIGDGRSTIRQLVAQQNRARLGEGAKLAHGLVSIDLDMANSLSRQALSLSSVPRNGTVIALKKVVNQNSSDDNFPAYHLLCDSIIAVGAAAAAAVGARFAGVDVIARDPGRPLSQTGGVVLEVNTTPAFHQHCFRRGAHWNPATTVLQRLIQASPYTTQAATTSIAKRQFTSPSGR